MSIGAALLVAPLTGRIARATDGFSAEDYAHALVIDATSTGTSAGRSAETRRFSSCRTWYSAAANSASAIIVTPKSGGNDWLSPALNDFASGFATLFQQTSSARVGHRSRTAALFIQDDWRVLPGLSISAGLRWELNTPYFDIRDRLIGFRAGVQSQVFPDAPAGLVYPGDPGVSRSTYSADRNDFSARFGFAWDVLRSGRLSVRGGYGLLYDAPFEEILFNASLLSPPYSISPSTRSTDYANPWLGSRVTPIPQLQNPVTVWISAGSLR